MEAQVVYANQLPTFMQRLGAQFVGRNEAGGNVYRATDGTTYVAVAQGDGSTVLIRRVGGQGGSCGC